MSRSCQSATFSSAGTTVERTSRASPVRFSDSTGLRLCGIDDEPFWPGAKYSSASRNSVRCEMADLGREPLDRRGDQRQRHEELGVAVARDHLGRDRLGREAELLGDIRLDRRVDVGEGADRARNRAGRDLAARRDEARRGRGRIRPNARRASARRSSARHGCRGCGRSSACTCARRRGASAPPSSPSRSASRRSAASFSCTARQVSSTSLEVMPWWTKRASGPTCSARLVRKAIMS